MKDVKQDAEPINTQPPTEETVRELIVSVSNATQQIKRMYNKVPKFDVLKFTRLILIGILAGVFLAWYLPRHLHLPGVTVINAGIAFAPQDGITVMTWGDSSRAFIDCIKTPAVDRDGNPLPNKECKLVLHNISNS